MEIAEIIGIVKDMGMSGLMLIGLILFIKHSKNFIKQLASCIVEEMRDELKLIYSDLNAIKNLSQSINKDKK